MKTASIVTTILLAAVILHASAAEPEKMPKLEVKEYERISTDQEFEMKGVYYFDVERGLFAGGSVEASLTSGPSAESEEPPLFTGGRLKSKTTLTSVEIVEPDAEKAEGDIAVEGEQQSKTKLD